MKTASAFGIGRRTHNKKMFCLFGKPSYKLHNRMKSFDSIPRFVVLLFALLLVTSLAKAQKDAPRKILFFSKSSGYEHDMIKRHNGEPSKAENVLSELGRKNNIEFTFTKDGSVFTPENIASYDAFFFYTTGDLTEVGSDKNPPMPKEGKAVLLEAIANGKGFIGVHSATDTFHSPGYGKPHLARSGDEANIDPYIKMIGGEFIIHGAQQRARQICADRNFPGMGAVPDDFGPLEEWYSLKYFAPDLHVLLVQDTSTMLKSGGGNKRAYDRPNYPSTWVREYGGKPISSMDFPHGAFLLLHKPEPRLKGRVFYTSMGHREDIWTSPVFQQVLLGGMNWVLRRVDADVTPNIKEVTPQAGVLPPD
jgi:hypothetical protein